MTSTATSRVDPSRTNQVGSYQSELPQIILRFEKEIFDQWIMEQLNSTSRRNLLKEDELKTQSRQFLSLFQQACQSEGFEKVSSNNWTGVRTVLNEISRSRALQGFTPSETATFVFSLKAPLFSAIRKALNQNMDKMFNELWLATLLLDHFGLYTTEVFQKSREDVIQRQQAEMLELSTPVVKLWDGVVALPMIGTLDSARTQIVMETLLQKIVETGAEVAIIDITGVPTVDTLVAQHLIKTVSAARLMGADCIISGVRPQIAQTMVHLAVDLQDIITKSTLADAFLLALQRVGFSFQKSSPHSRKRESDFKAA